MLCWLHRGVSRLTRTCSWDLTRCRHTSVVCNIIMTWLSASVSAVSSSSLPTGVCQLPSARAAGWLAPYGRCAKPVLLNVTWEQRSVYSFIHWFSDCTREMLVPLPREETGSGRSAAVPMETVMGEELSLCWGLASRLTPTRFGVWFSLTTPFWVGDPQTLQKGWWRQRVGMGVSTQREPCNQTAAQTQRARNAADMPRLRR